MTKRRIGSLILSLALLTGSIAPIGYADTKKFKDLKSDYWAAEFIKVLVESGILSGYNNGTFAPEQGISREEFAVVLYKTFGLHEYKPTTQTFKDVDASRWSYTYIEAGKEYLTGYFPSNDKATFAPEGAATREDVAVALVRALNINLTEKGNPNDLAFKDISDISPDLRDEIALAVKHELLAGFPDKTFRPDAPITRAQASAMVYKVIQSPEAEKLNKKSVSKTNEPEIIISNWTDTTTSNSIVVKGTIKDRFGSQPTLKVNGVEKTYNSNNSFELTLPLEKGLNPFTFTTIDKEGTVTEITKNVTYNTSTPVIKLLTPLPAVVNISNYRVKFKVEDPYDRAPTVYVNGKITSLHGSDPYHAQLLSFIEGNNDVLIEVTNKQGFSASQTFKVEYIIGAPQITFFDLPEKSDKANIDILLKIVDPHKATFTLMVNDKKYAATDNTITTTPYTLVKGENKIVFQIINSKGQITVVEKIIMY